MAERPIHCVCGRVVAFTDPALEAELAAARRRLGLLEPLASALEDDERHGNLSGRAEGAWDVARRGKSRDGPIGGRVLEQEREKPAVVYEIQGWFGDIEWSDGLYATDAAASAALERIRASGVLSNDHAAHVLKGRERLAKYVIEERAVLASSPGAAAETETSG